MAVASLSENLILQKARVSDMQSVKSLNLWGCNLEDVNCISKASGLEILTLSVNAIRSLDAICECKGIRELYLRKNDIRSLAEVYKLRSLPKLETLWLADNPCCSHDKYRAFTIHCCPNLKQFDNVEISPQERAASNAMTPEELSSITGIPVSEFRNGGAPVGQAKPVPAAVAVPPPVHPALPPVGNTPVRVPPPQVPVPAPVTQAAPPPSSGSSESEKRLQRNLVTAVIPLLNEMTPASLELVMREVDSRLKAQRR
jgi:hypothetical protein